VYSSVRRESSQGVAPEGEERSAGRTTLLENAVRGGRYLERKVQEGRRIPGNMVHLLRQCEGPEGRSAVRGDPLPGGDECGRGRDPMVPKYRQDRGCRLSAGRTRDPRCMREDRGVQHLSQDPV